MMSARSQRKGKVPLITKQGEIPMVTNATRLVNMFTRPRPVRSTSPSSTDADYGESDEDEVETMEEYAENLLEEEEVYHWLTCSDPQPWSSPEIEAPMEVRFTMSRIPGPLFLQLFQFLMVYFGFVPRQKEYSMPVPYRMPARRPLSLVHYFDRQDKAKQARYLGLIGPPQEDDMTYVALPCPGRNEELERIRMTKDYRPENLDTHKPNTLRIYRVPKDKIMDFICSARTARLNWLYVRKPLHVYDTVAVYRHGYRTWDFSDKDEIWALASSRRWTDSVRLRAIANRTTKWPLSRKGRIYFGYYRLINWILRRLGITVQVNVPNLL